MTTDTEPQARVERRHNELIERFRAAVLGLPYVAERVAAGQQFNAYESADNEEDDDYEDWEYRIAIGPITNFRLITDVEGKARADLLEAALKLAAHSAFTRFDAAHLATVGEDENWPRLGQGGRFEVGYDDPLYKAFRPKPETIAAIEKNEQANAEGLAAIRDMMFGHVTNWPEPKRFGTAISLIDKTLTAALRASPSGESEIAALSRIADEYEEDTQDGALDRALDAAYWAGRASGPSSPSGEKG